MFACCYDDEQGFIIGSGVIKRQRPIKEISAMFWGTTQGVAEPQGKVCVAKL